MNRQMRCDGKSTTMSAVAYGYITLSWYGVQSVGIKVAVQSQIKICLKLLSRKTVPDLESGSPLFLCPIGLQGLVTWLLQAKKIG